MSAFNVRVGLHKQYLHPPWMRSMLQLYPTSTITNVGRGLKRQINTHLWAVHGYCNQCWHYNISTPSQEYSSAAPDRYTGKVWPTASFKIATSSLMTLCLSNRTVGRGSHIAATLPPPTNATHQATAPTASKSTPSSNGTNRKNRKKTKEGWTTVLQ